MTPPQVHRRAFGSVAKAAGPSSCLYRSPTVPGKAGKPMLRRVYFGEHSSGQLGEPRYLTLKQFETDFSILRGKIAKASILKR